MTIYIDELFIINFISCFSILYVFAAFAELERRWLRLIFAALSGSAIAVIRFCFGFDAIFIQILELIIPVTAFGKIKLRTLIMFIIMRILLSGIINTVVSAVGGSSAVIRGGIVYLDINPLLFLAVFIIVYPLLCLILRLIRRQRRKIYTLMINGISVKALYDSGNLLKNPYDGSGVIIIERSCIDFDEDEGFMLIPCKTLNNSSMLKAFKVQDVFCKEKNMKIENITIGISENALSQSGQYSALVGPAVFKE